MVCPYYSSTFLLKPKLLTSSTLAYLNVPAKQMNSYYTINQILELPPLILPPGPASKG